jgi:hypothetical protein
MLVPKEPNASEGTKCLFRRSQMLPKEPNASEGTKCLFRRNQMFIDARSNLTPGSGRSPMCGVHRAPQERRNELFARTL